MEDKSYIGFRAEDMGFDAHCTLLYTGKLNSIQEQLVDDILNKCQSNSFWVQRDKIKLFGPHNNIPVVTLHVPTYFYTLRLKLIRLGIPNPSEYSWNPHITLDFNAKMIKIPKQIRLTALRLY